MGAEEVYMEGGLYTGCTGQATSLSLDQAGVIWIVQVRDPRSGSIVRLDHCTPAEPPRRVDGRRVFLAGPDA